MATFYFDIETTGLDPQKGSIITIQFQELERNTGKPVGELTIMKAWESSEKAILQEFLSLPEIIDDYDFSFIPVGYNLGFEHKFLKERLAAHGLPSIDILNMPFIDLRTIGILMKKGEFKGSGLDKISGKPSSGRMIPTWHSNKEYDKIIEYVKTEALEFNKLAMWLWKELPELLLKYEREHMIKRSP